MGPLTALLEKYLAAAREADESLFADRVRSTLATRQRASELVRLVAQLEDELRDALEAADKAAALREMLRG